MVVIMVIVVIVMLVVIVMVLFLLVMMVVINGLMSGSLGRALLLVMVVVLFVMHVGFLLVVVVVSTKDLSLDGRVVLGEVGHEGVDVSECLVSAVADLGLRFLGQAEEVLHEFLSCCFPHKTVCVASIQILETFMQKGKTIYYI